MEFTIRNMMEQDKQEERRAQQRGHRHQNPQVMTRQLPRQMRHDQADKPQQPGIRKLDYVA